MNNTIRCFAAPQTTVALLGAGAILAAADFSASILSVASIADAIEVIAATLPNVDRDDVRAISYADSAGRGIALICGDETEPFCVLEDSSWAQA